ncbi:Vgb family protein [Sphingomonas adhaesiva]|uniref:Vgb family protein n=1 Tax=Sphingomonas adhaesiva TaxID=28212 RepID=UPI003FA7A602
MMRPLIGALALAIGWSMPAMAQQEQVIAVPGFADFLAVDGDAVWATNKGRVERWARDGLKATVPMAHPCGAMAFARGTLWVADCDTRTLNRIDAAAGRVAASIPTGVAAPDGELNVVAGAGAIWIASDAAGAVARVDPSTDKVVATIAVTPGTSYLAFGFDAVWAVSLKGQTLQRIDPATDTVVATIPLGARPGFLAAGEGAVWVQEQGDGTVARIDPASNTVVGRVKVGATLKYGDIDTGGGKVWLRTTEDQTFAVIDPATMAVTARVGKAVGSGALRYTPAGVWTSAHDIHTLSWWPDPAVIAK